MLRRVSNAAKTAHVFQSMRTFTTELPGTTMPRLDSFRGIDPNLTMGKRGGCTVSVVGRELSID